MYQGVTQCFVDELKLNGGWMTRRSVVSLVYDNDMPINAHHRAIFKQLVAAGVVQERVTGRGDRQRFEYRYVR